MLKTPVLPEAKLGFLDSLKRPGSSFQGVSVYQYRFFLK